MLLRIESLTLTHTIINWLDQLLVRTYISFNIITNPPLLLLAVNKRLEGASENDTKNHTDLPLPFFLIHILSLSLSLIIELYCREREGGNAAAVTAASAPYKIVLTTQLKNDLLLQLLLAVAQIAAAAVVAAGSHLSIALQHRCPPCPLYMLSLIHI